MKLSIIIPYFNTPAYTDELLSVLAKQMDKSVEVILIDDGSDVPYRPTFDFLKVIRTNNQGQSKARNLGLNRANGDYIQFIDSDDLVPQYFIPRLLKAIEEGSDIIEYSWQSLDGKTFNYFVKEGERLSNPSACTRCFKRSFIGDHRFSEKKDATEDEDFTRHLGIRNSSVKVSIIPELMYFYRTDTSDSNVKRYKQGKCKTKRIAYYFNHVEKDRTDILEAIKKDDEENEVFLLTNRNDMPELLTYCQVIPPIRIWTHYLKGEPYMNIEIVQIPIKAEIILYINFLAKLGGIETFIYHFAKVMEGHDIILVVADIPELQRKRLGKVVKIDLYRPDKIYLCENLIMLRILDMKPQNIYYRNSVQMSHACKTNPLWMIPNNSNHKVCVSNVAKESFGKNGNDAMVIHNVITKSKEKALMIVSATRIPAPDKGGNEERMKRLAEMLNEKNIPFVWFNFSDNDLPNAPKGLINVGAREDIQPFIKRADYLVQLSDSEAWSYSVLEALVNNVPVIVTPFPSAYEMGIEDGKNGYIIPFDMDFDVTRLLKIPKFKYEYDVKAIRDQWESILKGAEDDTDRT